MRLAVYPGGFDPLTNGHLDLVTRMTHLFDRVVVAVVRGRDKGSLFTVEERVELVQTACAHLPCVEVESFTGLMVDYASSKGAVAVVQGIRAISDFESEFDQAMMNRKMAPHLESVYLMANQENLFISATRIREVSRLGYDVADLVPANVRTALRQKYGQD